jgi:MFS family permease
MEFNRVYFPRRIALALGRPFLFCVGEPMILIFSCYLGVIFIILYTFSAGYVSIFEKVYHLDQGRTGICFLGILVGVLTSALPVPLSMKYTRRDIYRARDRGLARPEKESNLYMAMFGAPAIPIGLFWMGWTAYPHISMWSPIISSVVFGFGIVCVFVSAYQYVAAAYEYHPGSALASLQMFRLTAAGVMAVIADLMHAKLGPHWSLTVLGGIATVFLPVPCVLYIWGRKVRTWSRYAPTEET